MDKKNLTRCTSCGAEISKGKKITCPECGKVNKRPVYKRPWFIIVAVFIAIGIIGNMGSGDDTDGKEVAPISSWTSTESEPVVEPELEVKEPLIMTVDKLNDALDENALKASNNYKGEYVEVTGILSVIDSDGKYFALGRLDGKFTLQNLTCNISKEHLDDVMDFEMKQEVTVIGTITDVGEIMGYRLKVEKIK